MKKLFTLLFLLTFLIGINESKAANATVMVGPNNTNTFSPAQVSIKVGEMVTWQWASGTHDVTSTTGAWVKVPITSTNPTFSHTFANAGTYSYYCSIHGQNVMSGTVIVTSATGTKENRMQSAVLNLYPNPAQNVVKLQVNLTSADNYELRFTNAIGRTVKTIGSAELKAVKETEIDLSDMAGGVYFYTLWNNDKIVESRRLVIQK